MTDAQFSAEVSAQLAEEIRLLKLRELIRREYAELHKQEMLRQRPAMELWDEERRVFTNHDGDEDARLDDPRHGQADSLNRR